MTCVLPVTLAWRSSRGVAARLTPVDVHSVALVGRAAMMRSPPRVTVHSPPFESRVSCRTRATNGRHRRSMTVQNGHAERRNLLHMGITSRKNPFPS
jgi:hypothetical protein